MQQIDLLLLRHGDCDGGVILRGRVDVPLSELGWQQMSAAVNAELSTHDNEAVPANYAGRVYTSPAKRCADFATQLAADLPCAFKRKSAKAQFELVTLDGLQELDFGDWDGRSLTELYACEGDMLAAYWQNPWRQSPPNGEPMALFEARVNQAISAILDTEFQRDALNCKTFYREKSRCADTEMPTEDVEERVSVQGLSLASAPTSSQASSQAASQAGVSNKEPVKVWLVTHGGVIRHLMMYSLGIEAAAGFYRQLSLPVAALVKITVWQEDNGKRHWRLHWPVSC